MLDDAVVTIDHVGPVEFFEVDFSSGPGVYELTGTRGLGKSTVLQALDLLAGRKVSLTVTDGFTSGSVKGFGVVAPVGGKKRRRGTFAINSLDAEKFSLDDIVSPQVKDPVAADVTRIKALVSLRGVEAEVADYFDVLGGRPALEALLPSDKLETNDPVLLASRIKEALEAKARQHEGTAKHESTHAESYRIRSEGVDLTQEADPRVLQDQFDSAKAAQLQLVAQQKAYLEDATRRQNAIQKLATAESSYQGPTQEAAAAELERAGGETAEWVEEIDRLTALLITAKAQLNLSQEREESARRQVTASRQHAETCAAWRQTIEANPVFGVSLNDLEAAGGQVEQARTALENGVRVRDAMQALEQGRTHRKAAEAEATKAEQFRAKAASIFDVLSSLVKAPGISVQSVEGDPRLVVRHTKRGRTLYSELSDGERVIGAMNAVLDILGKPAILPVGQRLWQDLPPADRLEINKYAQKHGLFVIGGQVSDDSELRLVRYHPAD